MNTTVRTENIMDDGVWVFGYGSLIWRPDFAYHHAQPAWLNGWVRRFWQGSHDHRGLPHAPGRVVTLIEETSARCGGMAYKVGSDVIADVFENLDYREKNGYQRLEVELTLLDSSRDSVQNSSTSQQQSGVVYIAPIDNFAYLGEADLVSIAQQIAVSSGPSGSNREYLFKLASALRKLNFEDDHVFQIEQAVRAIIE